MRPRHRLNPEQYAPQRQLLRTLGPLVLAVGVIFIIVGFVDFFSAMGSFRGPRLFWCFFAGMPLLFAGGVMTMLGYQRAILRYHANESAPVMRDSFNYLADGTRDGVKTLASSLGAGLAEGLSGGAPVESTLRCRTCSEANDPDARFCKACGASLSQHIPCPKCAERNDPDARFCDNCGTTLAQG